MISPCKNGNTLILELPSCFWAIPIWAKLPLPRKPIILSLTNNYGKFKSQARCYIQGIIGTIMIGRSIKATLIVSEHPTSDYF